MLKPIYITLSLDYGSLRNFPLSTSHMFLTLFLILSNWLLSKHIEWWNHAFTRKSRTCEKGEAHLRICFWHLLMTWRTLMNILILLTLGHLLPFYPHKNPKIKILKNEKNFLKISSFYTCVPKITIIWCMIPEIWSESGRIFWVIFWPFSTLTNQKTKNLKLKKKTPGDIIPLHICTINDNYMMYGSWDMKCNRQNFFVILDYFCPFTPSPLQTQKIKILEKLNTHLKILSLYTCVP